MPTVNLNREVVEDLVGKKLDIETLRDRISMLGTDLDEVTETEINVEIFPNRPDMLCEQGFARALSSFVNEKTGLINYKSQKSNYKVIVDKSVSEVRPFTACAVVKNLKLDEEKIKSIIQLQEKLHTSFGRNRKKVAIGVYPLEKIKFPITYKALPPNEIKFIPLEYSVVLTGSQILSKTSTGRDYAHLLENEDLFPIFIDKNNEILSMPPIINSNTTGKVEKTTTEVFVECSGFEFETLKKGLNIIITSLADMGGEIYEVNLTKETTPDLKPEVMKVNPKNIEKTLGIKLKEKEIKELLERMGYDYENSKVKIPCYRADVLHEVDIITDIAIAYGYENFKPIIPNISTTAEESKISKLKRKVSELLVGLNLIECSSFHLSNPNTLNKKMKLKNSLIEVESPVNLEYNMLRNYLLPNLLEVLQKNKQHEYPQNIFEIGNTFEEDKDSETKIKEIENVSVVKCEGNFTEIKQVLDTLFRALDLKYEIEELSHKSFIEGRAGSIIVNDKKVGILGEIHPEVLTNFELETPCSALELHLSELIIA